MTSTYIYVGKDVSELSLGLSDNSYNFPNGIDVNLFQSIGFKYFEYSGVNPKSLFLDNSKKITLFHNTNTVFHASPLINPSSEIGSGYQKYSLNSLYNYINYVHTFRSLTPYIIVHAGFPRCSSEDKKSFLDFNRKILSAFKTGSMPIILYENMSNLSHGFFNLCDYVSEINHPNIGICLDTAHLYACGETLTNSSSDNSSISEYKSKYSHEVIEELVRRFVRVVHLNSIGEGCYFGTEKENHSSPIMKSRESEYVLSQFDFLQNINIKNKLNIPFIFERPRIQDSITDYYDMISYVSIGGVS